MLKVKLTAKVQNLSSVPLITLVRLGNQTGCADLLLLFTKPSTTKSAYTDSITFTRHTTAGGDILPRKPTNAVYFVAVICSSNTELLISLFSFEGMGVRGRIVPQRGSTV